jgi:hypothetical protein
MFSHEFFATLTNYQQQNVRIVYICTENDVNGNPRRSYYDLKEGIFYDEGYMGHHAVPEHLRQDALEAEYNYKINLKPRQYKMLIKSANFFKNISTES